jgi:uncharacterized protein (DUF736 family)
MNNSTNKWSDREIGALWKREGKSSGRKYLAGHMVNADGEKEKVVVFMNSNKTNDKAPDFRVYRSEELSTATESSSTETSESTEQQTEDTADLLQ